MIDSGAGVPNVPLAEPGLRVRAPEPGVISLRPLDSGPPGHDEVAAALGGRSVAPVVVAPRLAAR